MNDNPYAIHDDNIAAAYAPVDARVAFLKKTYTLLLAGILTRKIGDIRQCRGSRWSSVSCLGFTFSLGFRSSGLTLGGSSRLGVAVTETAVIPTCALASVPERETHLI